MAAVFFPPERQLLGNLIFLYFLVVCGIWGEKKKNPTHPIVPHSQGLGLALCSASGFIVISASSISVRTGARQTPSPTSRRPVQPTVRYRDDPPNSSKLNTKRLHSYYQQNCPDIFI